ncbi:NAD-dependent protein deacetylase sirtuin-1 [Galendromus occidentalis]|uniref:protein acetyllysine N-acetyltransferase n=1 Tax=Galendromus occidentalis TaxID=34638 RepID=A0AAJ6QNT1_9ACAR|nr:NAD-dependent protein deacetylase sirtuin-1 [Galendromus occidentalis]
MAGPEISQNAQFYPTLDASTEPPSKRMRVLDDQESPSTPERLNAVSGETVSSDNGDSGFLDIAGRCGDDSSSDSDDSILALRGSTVNPLAWVSAKMQAGVDPRPLLEKLLPLNIQLPALLDRMTMWNILIELLGDDDKFHKPPRPSLSYLSTLDDALHLLTTCRKIIVLTGAGVSVSCGIPDFRSSNGIYARLRRDFPSLPDPQAMFDMTFFRQDPRPFFKFAREIYPGLFEPSASHHFIRGLEKRGQLLRNYTQNIDTLEYACGLERVIACHGGFSTATCTRCDYKVDCEALRADIFAQRVPLCPKCPQPEVQHWETQGDESPDSRNMMAVMKPDIVFFGEGLPKEFHEKIKEDRDDADLLIVMGSSLKVRPVASIPHRMDHKVPQILINREALPHIGAFDVQLLGDCDVVIRELCARLDDWRDEPWLNGGRPSTEPDHPYTLVDLSEGESVPKEQPYIYRVANNTYAFSGAELFSNICTSDDEESSSSSTSSSPSSSESSVSDSESSDTELIVTLVDSLVYRVAGQNLEDETRQKTTLQQQNADDEH